MSQAIMWLESLKYILLKVSILFKWRTPFSKLVESIKKKLWKLCEKHESYVDG